MADNKKERGPMMDWLNRIQNPELMSMFMTEFFGDSRRMKSAFRCGHYIASAAITIKMVKWWASFGVQIRPGEIRPDLYGPEDRGPRGVSNNTLDKQGKRD